MSASTRRVREDFDRIALLAERHGLGAAEDSYSDYLLSQLPPRPAGALEIGCGAGGFTQLLAARARSVTAIDLSPQMLRLAKSRPGAARNVEYLLGDFMLLPLAADAYDCVVSIATLHHLPLDRALRKMKDSLRPGGVLVIHDLIADDGFADRCASALACAAVAASRFWRTGRVRAPREVREAWAEHGRGEVYLTPAGVRRMCDEHLHAARVVQHLLWRYTVAWRKPDEARWVVRPTDARSAMLSS